ncbi:MAG: hypothetical protein ACOWWM_03450 [Desulfobacterales bacterium]
MEMIVASGPCRHCGNDVMAVCRNTQHRLHFVLFLLTAGMWLPFWLSTALSSRRCICCECGRPLPAADVKHQAMEDALRHPWDAAGAPIPIENFNALLVARDLVYYVPTLAIYRRR